MEDKNYISISTELVHVLTSDQAWNYKILPKKISGNSLEFYIDESANSSLIADELMLLLGKNIVFHPQPSELLTRSLLNYYRKNGKHGSEEKNLNVNYRNDDFLSDLVNEARIMKSSDIHVECYEDRCRVRYRVDGKLAERYVIKKEDYPALINKIKIRANLDIAEKRLPQDGRIFFAGLSEKFDIRVSVLPTLYGEKVVLRLLSKETTDINLTQLGFDKDQLDVYLEAIKKPHGIILISGPTGSGKTTTLYATLKILNKIHSNILTIEDPIEYTLEGVNQVQLKESIGLTFPSAMRTFLRQDPDVIMVGEIRDQDTAQMAIRAALTGHMVLSTIHTNSAWGTITRLIDMEIPSFLVANTMSLSVAQRLVRILCPACKRKEIFNNKLFPLKYKAPAPLSEHYVAPGCEHCFYTGYQGRKALYEIIPIDSEIAECIKSVKFEINHIMAERNIKTIAGKAFDLLAQGETSIDEIYPLLLNDC